MEQLMPGMKAPDFTLPDANGQTHRLSDYQGKRIVLYFYPKDRTPGCTKEACSFRNDYDEYAKQDIQILGVSPDPPVTHTTFSKKHNIPFPLLSDTEKGVMKKYGVWGLKKMYGREFMGVIRKTHLIDKTGTIVKIYPKVRVNGHSEAVLKAFNIL